MATQTLMLLFAGIEGSAAVAGRPGDARAGAGYDRLIGAGTTGYGR